MRRALGLTQEEFATRYHIPIGTLRDWEQGRAQPDQRPAQQSPLARGRVDDTPVHVELGRWRGRRPRPHAALWNRNPA